MVNVISIRAPARGATRVSSEFPGTKKISIRAPARGATIPPIYVTLKLPFQSALPRGERREVHTYATHTRHFNPRSREGSDGGSDQVTVYGVISIRAPARGATFAYDDFSFGGYISIRAPARGATANCRICDASMIFQSALPRGERPAEML